MKQQQAGIEVGVKPKGYGSIVLSPHSDDAAFSLGALIVAGVLPKPITLITVFSHSGFTKDRTFGEPSQVSKIRRDEDIQYARRIGAEVIFLDYEDALIRESGSDLSAVFSKQLPKSRIIKSIAEDIERIRAPQDDYCLVSPVGFGNHIDHLIVENAVSELQWDNTFYYADQPYAGLNPVKPICEHKYLKLVAVAKCSDWVINKKSSDVEIYQSQPAAKRICDLLAAGSRNDIVEILWEIGN